MRVEMNPMASFFKLVAAAAAAGRPNRLLEHKEKEMTLRSRTKVMTMHNKAATSIDLPEHLTKTSKLAVIVVVVEQRLVSGCKFVEALYFAFVVVS